MDARSPMQIAEAMGRLAKRMQAQTDVSATLTCLVTAAGDIVPGINWAAVSLVRGETVIPNTFSDDIARTLDELQGHLREGPAVDVLVLHRTVVIPDLAAETRWPTFVKAATDLGVHCMVSYRLFADRGTIGVLTLYGPTPHRLDDDAVLYGEILAQHAAIAMAGAQAEEQMQRAIASRDVIGQAKGIIMERFHVTAIRAFELLTQLSQENNIKLIDIAQQIIAASEAPQP